MSRKGRRDRPRPAVTPAPEGRSSFDLVWWGLLGAAFAIKVAVALQLDGHLLLQPRGTSDTAYYVQMAQRVAQGDLLLRPDAYFISPLYIYFLGAVFAVAGPSLLAARLVQALLGTVGLGLAMSTARQWFGRPGALLTGVLLAGSGIVTFLEVVVLQSALDPALMALDCWLIARAARRDTPGSWALAGGALGLHALNRPNMLAAAVVCVAVLAWRAYRLLREVRRAAVLGLAMGLGTAIAIAPAALRNMAVSGEPILITSHGGLNYYIGNHAEADGAYRVVPGITPSIEGQAVDARRLASEALGHRATDRETSAWFYDRAWTWIAAHPGDAMRLTGRKVLFALNAASPSLNYSYPFFRQESRGLSLLVLGPWILIPLGLAGAWLMVRRRGSGAAPPYEQTTPPGLGIVLALCATYGATLVAFFVTDRYRLPLLVPCAIVGGDVLRMAWAARREPSRLVSVAAPLALALLAVNVPLALEDSRAETQIQMSVALVREGDAAAAEARMAEALPGHPAKGVFHFRVARAYADRRQFDEAIRHLTQARAIDPSQREIDALLGQVYAQSGRYEEAIPLLRSAIASGAAGEEAPVDLVRALAASGKRDEAAQAIAALTLPPTMTAESLLALGTLALSLERPDHAVRFLTSAAAKAPGNAAVRENLGVAQSFVGNLPAAMRELESAASLAPQSATVHLNLAVTYARSGRLDDARRHAREALRLRPDYAQARALLERLP